MFYSRQILLLPHRTISAIKSSSVRCRSTIVMATAAILVLVAGQSFAQMSSGTGFFITRSGHFITSHHVVDGANKILIRTVDGTVLPATVIANDRVNDLVLLKVSGKTTPLPLIPSRAVKSGTSVITIGFPNLDIQGVEPKITSGIVSSLAGINDDPTQFQISVPVQPGNSGGPLLTIEGNVIGVIASKLNAVTTFRQTGTLPENVSYAVKASYISALLETQPLPVGALLPTSQKKAKDFSEIASRAEKSIGLVLVDTNRMVEQIKARESAKKDKAEQLEKSERTQREADDRARQQKTEKEQQANMIKYRITLLERDRDVLVNQYNILQQNPPKNLGGSATTQGFMQGEWNIKLQEISDRVMQINQARAAEIRKLEDLYR